MRRAWHCHDRDLQTDGRVVPKIRVSAGGPGKGLACARDLGDEADEYGYVFYAVGDMLKDEDRVGLWLY